VIQMQENDIKQKDSQLKH